MTTPAPSICNGSSLLLHKSLNDFDQIQQLITELAALECLKIFISTFSRLLLIGSFLNLQITRECTIS